MAAVRRRIVADDRPEPIRAGMTLDKSAPVNARRVEQALDQLGISGHGHLLQSLLSALDKRIPEQAMTINYALGSGTKLEVHVYNERMNFTFSPPPPAQQSSSVTPASIPPSRRKNLTVKNKILLIQNSGVLVSVLQQALDYKPRKGDNRPPPDLWLEDENYLEDVRALVDELKRLIDLLEKRGTRAVSATTGLNLKKHANTFLTNYSATLGKGTALLTCAVLGNILYQLGLAPQLAVKLPNVLK